MTFGVDLVTAGGAAVEPDAPREAMLADVAPDRSLLACVVVPARDEAAALPAALAALAAQTDLSGKPLDPACFEVIVLANNCRDGSAEVARAVARRHPRLRLHVVERTLPPGEAHIGRARRLLMDEACRRLSLVGRHRGVIASTDADTRVDPRWLATTLREVALGADAVCGRILSPPDGGERAGGATRLYQLRDAAYRLLVSELEALIDPDPADPWPRHHQHFGASLAVTPEIYELAGGLPALPALEDMAFHAALRRVDARIRHSPRVRVVTSPRRSGRVPVGLSTQLGEWAAMARAGAPLLVEVPHAAELRIGRRRTLRTLWREAEVERRGWRRLIPEVAGRWGLDPSWLETELSRATTFGQLEAAVASRRRELGLDAGEPPWDARVAIPALRRRVAELRRGLPPVLPSLEQIQPVRPLLPAPELPETSPIAGLGEEGLVDLVAG